MNSQLILGKLSDESSFDSVMSPERFAKEFKQALRPDLAEKLYQLISKQRAIAITNAKSNITTCFRTLEQPGKEEIETFEVPVATLIDDLSKIVDLGKIRLESIKQKTGDDLEKLNHSLIETHIYVTQLKASGSDFDATSDFTKCINLLKQS